jgi:hypothetical protein
MSSRESNARLTSLKLRTTKKPRRHGDGDGLYLVADPSGARRRVLRIVVQGMVNRRGAYIHVKPSN